MDLDGDTVTVSWKIANYQDVAYVSRTDEESMDVVFRVTPLEGERPKELALEIVLTDTYYDEDDDDGESYSNQ